MTNPTYKRHHPRWHRERMPIFWWLAKLSYTRFISRELTSLAVAYAALLLLVQVWALARGLEAYGRFVGFLRSPAALAFHTLVVLGLLFHTLTWLHLAPKALVVRLGRRRLSDGVVLLAHYGAWIVASGLVAWALVGSS
jgi:fumarate reductase subunit C